MTKKKPGRPTRYKVSKRQHSICVTDEAWQGLLELAEDKGLSVSELIEQIGVTKTLPKY